MCMNVDLPDPDGPVTARNSPRCTSRFTPRSAFTTCSPTWYVLTRLRTEITVAIGYRPRPPPNPPGPRPPPGISGLPVPPGPATVRVLPTPVTPLTTSM